MRWNDGRTRFERFANRPFADEPLYSSPPRPSLTEKLIGAGCVATPTLSSSRMKCG